MDLITVSHIGCTYVALDLNRHPAAACPLTPVQVQVGWLISFCQYVGPTWIHHHSWIKIMPIGLSLTFLFSKLQTGLLISPTSQRFQELWAWERPTASQARISFLYSSYILLLSLPHLLHRFARPVSQKKSRQQKHQAAEQVFGCWEQHWATKQSGNPVFSFSWGTSCQALPLVGHVAACGLAPDQGGLNGKRIWLHLYCGYRNQGKLEHSNI